MYLGATIGLYFPVIKNGLEVINSVKLPILGSYHDDQNFSLSNEYSKAVDTRFEQVFVIIDQPNLASSFLKICPEGLLQKIPKNSFDSHPKKMEKLFKFSHS